MKNTTPIIIIFILLMILLLIECDYPTNQKFEPCYFYSLNSKLSDDSQISPSQFDNYLNRYLGEFGYDDINYKFNLDCKCYLVFKNKEGQICNLYKKKDKNEDMKQYHLDCDKFGKLKTINSLQNQIKNKKFIMKLGQIMDYKWKYRDDDMDIQVEHGQNVVEKRNVPYFRLMFQTMEYYESQSRLRLQYKRMNDLIKNNQRIKDEFGNRYWEIQEQVDKEIRQKNRRMKTKVFNKSRKRLKDKESDDYNSWNSFVLSDSLASQDISFGNEVEEDYQFCNKKGLNSEQLEYYNADCDLCYRMCQDNLDQEGLKNKVCQGVRDEDIANQRTFSQEEMDQEFEKKWDQEFWQNPIKNWLYQNGPQGQSKPDDKDNKEGDKDNDKEGDKENKEGDKDNKEGDKDNKDNKDNKNDDDSLGNNILDPEMAKKQTDFDSEDEMVKKEREKKKEELKKLQLQNTPEMKIRCDKEYEEFYANYESFNEQEFHKKYRSSRFKKNKEQTKLAEYTIRFQRVLENLRPQYLIVK